MQRKLKLSIAIPASVLGTEPTLLLKTIKASLIARAAAIFRVKEVLVYADPYLENRKDLAVLVDVLKYLVEPPYLKKYVPLKDTLKYVGAVPPLQAEHHPRSRSPRKGEVRLGIVVDHTPSGSLVDVGIGTLVEVNRRLPRGEKVAVRITSVNPIRCELCKKVDIYTGYEVKVYDSLRSIVEERKGKELIIATSRWGKWYLDYENDVLRNVEVKRGVTVLFGAPKHGLHEIASKEGWSLEELCDYIFNFVKDQGVWTIRTEEAVFIVLACLRSTFSREYL